MGELIANANNKIIDRDMLLEIFQAMYDELAKCKRIAEEEEEKNKPLQLQHQKWTLRFFSGDLRFTIHFKDNHSTNYDDYRDFLMVFKNQPFSIKYLNVNYTLSYNLPKEGGSGEHIYNSISLHASEDKFEVSSNLASGDQYMQEIYDLIMQKIASAPPKYDRVIQAKELISFKIGLAMGLVPAIILTTGSLFIPQMRGFYNQYFYLFPAFILLIGAVLGIFLGSARTAPSYAKLVPKKYGGWDSNTRKSYYTDDLQKLTETSDVLIGDKTDILTERKKIISDEERFSKIILPLLGVALVVTIIAFFVTR